MQEPGRRTGPELPLVKAARPTARKREAKCNNVWLSWNSHLECKNGGVGASKGSPAIRVGDKQPQIARDRASIGGCSCNRYPASHNWGECASNGSGVLGYQNRGMHEVCGPLHGYSGRG